MTFASLFIVYVQTNKFYLTALITNQTMKFMLEFTKLNSFEFQNYYLSIFKAYCRIDFVCKVLVYYLNLTRNIHEYFLLYLLLSFVDRLMVGCCLMALYCLSYLFHRYVRFEFTFSIDLLLMCNFSNLFLFFFPSCRLLLIFANSLKLLMFLTNAFLLIFKLQIIISEVFEILIFLFEI